MVPEASWSATHAAHRVLRIETDGGTWHPVPVRRGSSARAGYSAPVNERGKTGP